MDNKDCQYCKYWDCSTEEYPCSECSWPSYKKFDPKYPEYPEPAKCHCLGVDESNSEDKTQMHSCRMCMHFGVDADICMSCHDYSNFIEIETDNPNTCETCAYYPSKYSNIPGNVCGICKDFSEYWHKSCLNDFLKNSCCENRECKGDREWTTGAKRDPNDGKGRMDLLPWRAIIEISKHCQKGAEHYGEHNVDRGIPLSSLCDSGARHLAKFIDGWDDEDHLVAAAWNILWAIQMRAKKPEMIDIPWEDKK